MSKSKQNNYVFNVLKLAAVFVSVISVTTGFVTTNAFGYDGSLTRTTLAGQIVGKISSFDGNSQAFLGIPYAKPPIGDLRWRAPQDPEPWSGIKAATETGNICLQVEAERLGGDGTNPIIGSEDCLFVNVWRPDNAADDLPVLFWIHGGAFVGGSSSLGIHDGSKFANFADAIFVSVNYRLGKLGWNYHSGLHNGDSLDDSGNYGFLDTAKGLEWVQANIAEFGGNPNNVTIIGESAGCVMVNGFLAASWTWDLYDKAICASGAPLTTAVDEAENSARSMANALIISDGLAVDEDAADIVQNSMIAQATLDDYLRQFSGVEIIENNVGASPVGDGVVLPSNIWAKMKTGGFNRVPIIYGTTKNEGSLFLQLSPTWGEEVTNLWFNFNNDITPPSEINDLIAPGDFVVFKSIEAVVDLLFNVGADISLRWQKKYQNNLYRYHYFWDDYPTAVSQLMGAYHASDVPIFFGTIDYPEHRHLVNWLADDDAVAMAEMQEVSNEMMGYFKNFLHEGRPNKIGDGLPWWPKWSNWGIDNKRIVFDDFTKAENRAYKLIDYLSEYSALSEQDRALVDKIINESLLAVPDEEGPEN